MHARVITLIKNQFSIKSVSIKQLYDRHSCSSCKDINSKYEYILLLLN